MAKKKKKDYEPEQLDYLSAEQESSKKAKTAKVRDLLKELIDASEKAGLKSAAKAAKRRKPAR